MPWDYLFQRLVLICVLVSYRFLICLGLYFSFLAHTKPSIQHCSLSKMGRRWEAGAFSRKRRQVNHSTSELPANQLFSGADRNDPSGPNLDCVSHHSCLWLWRRWLTASARRPLDYTNQVWLLLFPVFKLNQFIPDLLLLRSGSHSRTNKCKNFKSLNKYSCPTLLFLALVVFFFFFFGPMNAAAQKKVDHWRTQRKNSS